MGTASPDLAQSLSEERRKQMERDPFPRSTTQHKPYRQHPSGPSFLSSPSLPSQYLLAQGLHGAHWRELLKQG